MRIVSTQFLNWCMDGKHEKGAQSVPIDTFACLFGFKHVQDLMAVVCSMDSWLLQIQFLFRRTLTVFACVKIHACG